MALAPGTKLGTYEIVAALGAGGMGEVYRARDTKLKREVALKILPEVWSHDADRLARFQREAELLATLNHPNIAAVYGLEQSDGSNAIVLELVDGDTLADRIARGPLAIDDALIIARQIADALEAAHDKGVIHRDLKPANIKITPEDKVKVLDFGLAKMTEPSRSPSSLTMSPTLSVHATYEGVILGTAAYMSPEQARGKPVDRRTDGNQLMIRAIDRLEAEPLRGITAARVPFSHTTADGSVSFRRRATSARSRLPAGRRSRCVESTERLAGPVGERTTRLCSRPPTPPPDC